MLFQFTTVQDGQRAAVWDDEGRVEFVQGPARVRTRGRRVEVLERFAAAADEYLVVRFRDGHAEHVRGPAAVWFHPTEHLDVTVRPAVPLDANEALVVYRQEDQRVSRRVVRGPELFVPAAHEWLHEFRWHGADPRDHTKKVPRGLVFNKLRVIPDQTYFDVEDVRTSDDALLVVRLMIFFELADVEVMLDQTHDPVADFINAVSADVIDFTATRTFDRFKEETGRLNELATYSQLCGRASRIGYRVNKVVYRGYHASSKLQGMHDGAIEARTRLRLEAETERQAQELADLKLQREADRGAKRQEMEAAEVAHQNRLKHLAHEEDLRRKRAEEEHRLAGEVRAQDQKLVQEQRAAEQKLAHAQREQEQKLTQEVRTQEHRQALEHRGREQKLELTQRSREMALAHRQALHRERIALLQAMREMEVDLTRYLVARYQNPDQHIRVDGAAHPQLHLHERQ